jgi:hypothetical protein
MGVGEGGAIHCAGTSDGIKGFSHPNSFVAKSGAKLSCTLGGVRGDHDGDRMQLCASGAGGELRDGRGATCFGELSAVKRGALVAVAVS